MNIRNLVNKIDIYNLMIFNLLVLSIIGIITLGWESTLPQLLIAVPAAGFLDTVINYYKTKNFEISKSGIITGLFIGLILGQRQLGYVVLIASVIAIVGKHIGKYIMGLFKQRNHLFNPAMVGIFLSVLIFKIVDGWWGATNLIAVAILGIFLLYKFRRFHLVIPFLITHFLAVIAINLLLSYKTAFEGLLLSSTLYFFAFFMLIEPKTSPATNKGRIIYGVISGLILAVLAFILPAYMFTAGLLICNLLIPVVNYLSNLKISVEKNTASN